MSLSWNATLPTFVGHWAPPEHPGLVGSLLSESRFTRNTGITSLRETKSESRNWRISYLLCDFFCLKLRWLNADNEFSRALAGMIPDEQQYPQVTLLLDTLKSCIFWTTEREDSSSRAPLVVWFVLPN